MELVVTILVQTVNANIVIAQFAVRDIIVGTTPAKDNEVPVVSMETMSLPT